MPHVIAPATSFKKSTVVAYILWFLLGGFGAHRFYLHRHASAVIQLALWVFGWLTLSFLFGLYILFAWFIWWILDLFITAGMVTRYNKALRAAIEQGLGPEF